MSSMPKVMGDGTDNIHFGKWDGIDLEEMGACGKASEQMSDWMLKLALELAPTLKEKAVFSFVCIGLDLLEAYKKNLANRITQVDRGVFNWGVVHGKKPQATEEPFSRDTCFAPYIIRCRYITCFSLFCWVYKRHELLTGSVFIPCLQNIQNDPLTDREHYSCISNVQ